MNPIFRLGLMAGGVAILCQCGMTHSIDRDVACAWNEGLVWKRQPGTTRDYVPMDYNGPPVTSAGRGQWAVDPQDGYRFYIPAAGTRKFPHNVLVAEANKATNDYTRGQQQARNTAKTALFPALFPVFAMAVLFDPDNAGVSDGTSPNIPDSSSNSSTNCHNSGGHDGGGHCMSGGSSGGGGHGK